MAGINSLEETLEEENKRSVKDMSIHPNYTGLNDNFQNDICLLHLDDSFSLGPMRNEISLLKNESQLEGTKCTISGWGTKQVS